MDNFDSDPNPKNNPVGFDTSPVSTGKKFGIGNIFQEYDGLIFLSLRTIIYISDSEVYINNELINNKRTHR
jgi:hypothetical protein